VETAEQAVELQVQMALVHLTAVAVLAVLSELEVQRELDVLVFLVQQVALRMEDMGRPVVVSYKDCHAYLLAAVAVVDLFRVAVAVAVLQELLLVWDKIKAAAAAALEALI
jgi:hypothetical protein